MQANGNDRLAGVAVSISVSRSPDLLPLGFLETEVTRALGHIVRSLVYHGADIHYGGDLRSNEVNFTTALAREAAEMYRTSGAEHRDEVFVHHVSLTTWRQWSPEQLFRHVVELGDFGLVKLYRGGSEPWRVFAMRQALEGMPMGDGQASVFVESVGDQDRPGSKGQTSLLFMASTPADLLPLWSCETPPLNESAAALKEMRKGMARDETARVIICGREKIGREKGGAGVAEEALISLEAGSVVLPLPCFGGCAHDIALALGLLEEPLVSRKHGLDYAAQLELVSQMQEKCKGKFACAGIATTTLDELMTSDSPRRISELICSILAKASPSTGCDVGS